LGKIQFLYGSCGSGASRRAPRLGNAVPWESNRGLIGSNNEKGRSYSLPSSAFYMTHARGFLNSWCWRTVRLGRQFSISLALRPRTRVASKDAMFFFFFFLFPRLDMPFRFFFLDLVDCAIERYYVVLYMEREHRSIMASDGCVHGCAQP
jgi:hypothetical protein